MLTHDFTPDLAMLRQRDLRAIADRRLVTPDTGMPRRNRRPRFANLLVRIGTPLQGARAGPDPVSTFSQASLPMRLP